MHNTDLILTLSAGLITALGLGYATDRLRSGGPIGSTHSEGPRHSAGHRRIQRGHVQTAPGAGQATVYGDATRTNVLEKAGIATAVSMILSPSGSTANREAVRIARELNLRIQLAARADFLRDTAGVREAGADEIFTGGGEAAVAIAGSIPQKLGSMPEQLDEAPRGNIA